jgi:predicted lipid-binding transport protein (Tim44 family)
VKHLLVALSVAVAAVSLGLAPGDADAKRLGGGKPAGMQRQAPPPSSTPTNTPPSTANAPAAAAAPAAATTGAAAAAAAPKRNWMGPLAGLAAGLGIAALFSHLGMGEGLANFMMLALMAVAAFFVIRFLLARFGGGAAKRAGGPQLAGAAASAGGAAGGWQAQRQMPQPDAPVPAQQPAPAFRSALDETSGAPAVATPLTPVTLPGGMATADFERLAKMVFIRMQAANDAGNVDDLRKFTTPELFASLRLDLQERGAAQQTTDVVQIEAQVVEVAQEKGQDIVSVRFHGLVRESADAGAEPFNELWHLVRPADGAGEWAIAGITPVQ